MAKFFERNVVCFSSSAEMADQALDYLDDGSELEDRFKIERATVVAFKTDKNMRGFMNRQRDAVANGFEAGKVLSDSTDSFARDFKYVVNNRYVSARPFEPRDLDAKARDMLATLKLDPNALASIGLTVCGGALLESALSETTLTLTEIAAMANTTGFDIDLFVTSTVPYLGSTMRYRHALVDVLSASDDIVSVQTKVRGFACDVFVEYACGAVVKMQIVDLGVAATAMQIVQSFDVAPAKMYFCNVANRVVMTEDAAIALVNGVIPYDRRFIGDQRYPSRLVKYLRRTRFNLVLPDSAAQAAFRVVRVVRNRLVDETDGMSDERANDVTRRLTQWIGEMGASDVATFAATEILIAMFGGDTNRRGYGTTPRNDDFEPVSGGIGRHGLSLMGARMDAIVDLFGFFQLFKMLHEIQQMNVAA